MLDPKVDQVFRNVKASFEYRTDAQNCKVADRWNTRRENAAIIGEYGHLIGDCDDFALRCRELLDVMGIDNRLVICRVRSIPEPDNGHLICTVDGWALDNRCRSVTPVDQLDYDFLIQSGFHPGDKWHKCEVAQ